MPYDWQWLERIIYWRFSIHSCVSYRRQENSLFHRTFLTCSLTNKILHNPQSIRPVNFLTAQSSPVPSCISLARTKQPRRSPAGNQPIKKKTSARARATSDATTTIPYTHTEREKKGAYGTKPTLHHASTLR